MFIRSSYLVCLLFVLTCQEVDSLCRQETPQARRPHHRCANRSVLTLSLRRHDLFVDVIDVDMISSSTLSLSPLGEPIASGLSSWAESGWGSPTWHILLTGSKMHQAHSILPKASQIRAFRAHPDGIVHLGHIVSSANRCWSCGRYAMKSQSNRTEDIKSMKKRFWRDLKVNSPMETYQASQTSNYRHAGLV